jgi:hypothetical protein
VAAQAATSLDPDALGHLTTDADLELARRHRRADPADA